MLGSFSQCGPQDREAEQEAVLQIVAGAAPTATAMRTTFFFVMSSPRIYAQLVKKIEDTENGPVSSNPISDGEALKVTYLTACIKEGLRMWPPVVGLISKQVPPGGSEIMRSYVPGGTCICYAGFSLSRKKDIFGVSPFANGNPNGGFLFPGMGERDRGLAHFSTSRSWIFAFPRRAAKLPRKPPPPPPPPLLLLLLPFCCRDSAAYPST